jgi:hypothetical protein
MNAMKNRLEPLHLRDTARCASRGVSHFWIVKNISIAHTINNAVQFLCDLTRLPVPT